MSFLTFLDQEFLISFFLVFITLIFIFGSWGTSFLSPLFSVVYNLQYFSHLAITLILILLFERNLHAGDGLKLQALLGALAHAFQLLLFWNRASLWVLQSQRFGSLIHIKISFSHLLREGRIDPVIWFLNLCFCNTALLAIEWCFDLIPPLRPCRLVLAQLI